MTKTNSIKIKISVVSPVYRGEKMTNESLRGRLEIAESSYPIASKIISDTIAAGLVRLDDASKSRKYAQYVPKWA